MSCWEALTHWVTWNEQCLRLQDFSGIIPESACASPHRREHLQCPFCSFRSVHPPLPFLVPLAACHLCQDKQLHKDALSCCHPGQSSPSSRYCCRHQPHMCRRAWLFADLSSHRSENKNPGNSLQELFVGFNSWTWHLAHCRCTSKYLSERMDVTPLGVTWKPRK